MAHVMASVVDSFCLLRDCHRKPMQRKCALPAQPSVAPEHVRGAVQHLYDVLAAAFAAEGVDTHFTLMGDGNMHWGIVLAERHGVCTIHARHEHCAIEMASAYATVTGLVGVKSVTHGPSIPQIMTTLTTSARGYIPLIVFASE